MVIYQKNMIGINCYNLWFNVCLPGIMDDPNKRFQWAVEQMIVYAVVNTGVTTSWCINIMNFPQYDSYSSSFQSVSFNHMLQRNVQLVTKDTVFNGIGCPFNNTCALESGQ